jgi:hypothetical protein
VRGSEQRLAMRRITERSPVLAGQARKGEVAAAGGMSALNTGEVTFLGQTAKVSAWTSVTPCQRTS